MMISNDEMKDIMKVFKSLEEGSCFIDKKCCEKQLKKKKNNNKMDLLEYYQIHVIRSYVNSKSINR